MAQRHIHYESAFEDFIRSRGWPYVPVDEHRKAIFAGARVKSFDFLVYPPGGRAWLAEIKGRKFPYELTGGNRYWENWVTREDLADLERWGKVFGPGFEPVIVFAYWLTGPAARDPVPRVHTFRGQHYAFFWMPVESYARSAKVRSPRWDTLTLSTRDFRLLARPVG